MRRFLTSPSLPPKEQITCNALCSNRLMPSKGFRQKFLEAGNGIALVEAWYVSGEGVLSLRMWAAGSLLGLLGLTVGGAFLRPLTARAQELLMRKAKFKVAPVYPDLARRMSITGTVKLSVVVAPNGTVKSTKLVGGHPLLVNAAMDAIKKWKFEPGPDESTGIVEFKFQPQD